MQKPSGIMSKYLYCVGLVVLAFSYVIYQQYVTVETSVVQNPRKRYDYIIVGAGTTGCVLAARLTEDPTVKVLLVEAGEHINYLVRVPAAPTIVQQGPHDWAFLTKPQKYSSFGMWNQSQCMPRGKGLGGSGQINYLMHGFGLKRDFENWTRLGVKGWTFEDLVPYFMKAFGTIESEHDSNDFCPIRGDCPGQKAPMKLKLIDHYSELTNVFKQASSDAGGHSMFRRATGTMDKGARVSSYEVYLKPAMRRNNLHVLTKTHAVSIRFDKGKATSLYILKRNRQLDNIFVNKEIILSAGTIKTPQILMLSGIGPRKELEKNKIKVVRHMPRIGKNLHDHMNMPIYVSIKKQISVTMVKIFTLKTVWDYLWNHSGYLAFPPVAGSEFIDNSSALILFALGSANENVLRDLSNYKPRVFRQTFKYHNRTGKEGFMFLASCLQPRSRGSVTLSGDEALRSPVVDPNYLSHPYDVRCMIKAMRRAVQLISTRPFADIGAVIHWPRPERCASLWSEPVTDSYLECLLREVAVTGHHAGGTCSMGGGGAAVDSELRLKSVRGVRIVDASVLPSPLSLYPNSVLIGVAERAADIIRQL